MAEEKPETNNTDEEDRHRQVGAIKKFVESATVPTDHALDEIPGPSFQSRLFVAGPAFTQNARAHQRRQGQGNQTGGENRRDDRDRKFLEDASEQSRQKHQRNKNSGQRKRHRQNRERNLAGGIVGGFQNRFAVLSAPDHVFQKDNRIINQEPNCEGQRHQRQIVDRESEHAHDATREQE